MEKLLQLKESTSQKQQESKTSIHKNNFNFCYVIGKGGFGKVWKVQYKKTKEIFALKEMSKLKIIDKKSEKSINSEREFLSQLHHPFIVNMHYAFQDKDNLYLVMDMLSGGDLRYHISRYRRFSEEQTRFFIACMVYTLEYIHSNNVIHRDIKPENLVLDDKGYVRITDFGIAKENLEDNSSETSGTPGYMSPEVMRGKNHSFPVDFFAIGVIGYEFMIGKRPYYGKNRKEIKDQIFSSQACIKKEDLLKGWSMESADFINKLLLRKQEARLGFKNGARELRTHPWLKYYPWKELEDKTLPAPFMPENRDNFDKRYCESVDKITEETKMRYENILCGDAIKKAFVKFYYNKDEVKDKNEKNDKNKNNDKNNNKNNSSSNNNTSNNNNSNIINNYFKNSDKNSTIGHHNINSMRDINNNNINNNNTNNTNNLQGNSSTNLSNSKLSKRPLSHSRSEKEMPNNNNNNSNINQINNINNNIINIIDNSSHSTINQNMNKSNTNKNNYFYIQKNNNVKMNNNSNNKVSNNNNYYYSNNNINCNLSHNISSKNMSNNNSLLNNNINNNSCICNNANNNQFDKLAKNSNIFTNLKQTKYLFNYPKSNNYIRSSSVINLKNTNHCNNLPSNNIMINNNSNNHNSNNSNSYNNSNYHYYMNKLNSNKIKINYNSNNNSNLNNNNLSNVQNINPNFPHKKLNRVNSASKILGRSTSDYIIDNSQQNSKGIVNKNKNAK